MIIIIRRLSALDLWYDELDVENKGDLDQIPSPVVLLADFCKFPEATQFQRSMNETKLRTSRCSPAWCLDLY